MFPLSAPYHGAMLRYSLSITLGALLIFALQPLMGKIILPWFGGGPSIWSTCMLFFQLLLLAGYAYSHALDRKLVPRKQALVHLTGLGLACLLGLIYALFWPSPITPGEAFHPQDSSYPALRILLALGAAVALPFFLLSATSPLVQAWYRQAQPQRSPYRLYALSNLGSLTGLLAYPFLIEPKLGLGAQAWIWWSLFVVFALGMAVCAWPLLRAGRQSAAVQSPPAPADTPRPPWRMRLLWLTLSASGSAMLLASTNQICLNVAVVPFLWVLPLALYLLSFVLCFHDPRLADGRMWAPLFILTSLLIIAMLFHGEKNLWRLAGLELVLGLKTQVTIYSLHMMAACMLVHGELVRRKPDASQLTSFYLWMSIGGACGGLFVSLLAPAVFDGHWEFHISLLAVAALSLGAWMQRRPAKPLRIAALLGLAGLILALAWHPRQVLAEALHAERNFYGVVRVIAKFPDEPRFFSHMLYDGQIMHGLQLQTPRYKKTPTAYYSRESGLGRVLAHHPRRPEALRVGIIGLGIGTAAALVKGGDLLRFYEINPAVIRLARGEGGYFSFLADSDAEIQVVEGDARLQLKRELDADEPGRFDVLALDAFQSDAVPVHLLTREALDIYLRHLRPGGVLVLHVSNLYLDLEPLLVRLAEDRGLHFALLRNEDDAWVGLRSRWMFLSSAPDMLQGEGIREAVKAPRSLGQNAPLWTDDYSSLLPIMR